MRAGEAALAPDALVQSAQEGNGRGLDLLAVPSGRPTSARPLLSERATGSQLAALAAEPDSPRAQLERYIVVSYPAGVNLDEVRAELLQRPEVLFAAPNAVMASLAGIAAPAVVQGARGEGGDRQSPPAEWHLEMLKLPSAWTMQRGYAYVSALDNGLHVAHLDLRANWWSALSMDFTREFGTNVDELAGGASRAGHGTHVAGLIASSPNATLGTSGSCLDCRLVVSKVRSPVQGVSVDAITSALLLMSERGGCRCST